MAWSHVQDINSGATFSSATSASPAFGSNATVGNQVIILVFINSLTLDVSSISGLGLASNNWLRVDDVVDQNGFGTVGRFITFVGTPTVAGTTVNINFSGSVTGCINMMEFSGGTFQMDVVAYRILVSGTSGDLGNVQPASANTLIIVSSFSAAGQSSVTGPAGFTNLTLQSSGSNALATGWVIQTTATATHPTWTWGSAALNNVHGIAFQASGTTNVPYMRQSRIHINAQGVNNAAASSMTPLTGSALVCRITATTTSGSTATTTDSVNSWQTGPVARNATTGQLAAINYVLNVPASAVAPSTSITNLTGTSQLTCRVEEWVNISVKDASGSGATGNSTAPTDGGVTTTNNNDIIISVAAGGWLNVSTTAGYGTIEATAGDTLNGAWTIKTSTGTYTCTFSNGSSVQWVGIALALEWVNPANPPYPKHVLRPGKPTPNPLRLQQPLPPIKWI